MAKLSYSKRKRLPSSAFACPEQRKYPLTDAAHVRNAASRMAQARTTTCGTKGWKRICKAAMKFGIESETCGR